MQFPKRTIALALALASSACASSTSKALDQKLATQEPVQDTRELRHEASQLIENAGDLSSDQKQRLSILRGKVGSQLDDVDGQSLKLRSVLVEELLSPTYSIDEVALIKKRMKKLEDKRLAVIFDGVDEANAILGRQAREHRSVFRELFNGRNNTARE